MGGDTPTNLLAVDVRKGLEQMLVERHGKGGHSERGGAEKAVTKEEQGGEELPQSLAK